MITPQKHADSQIRLIKLKTEIAKLEAQEAEHERWAQIAFLISVPACLGIILSFFIKSPFL